MVSRKVKPVLVVDGEVIRLEVRVRVEEAEAEAEAKKGLEGHVAWLGLVAREVAGMSWEKENDLFKSDTVQLVADAIITFAQCAVDEFDALRHSRAGGERVLIPIRGIDEPGAGLVPGCRFHSLALLLRWPGP